MPERWRSPAARDLVAAVRDAGGTVERAGTGKLRITGPTGTTTVHEPSTETRRDLRRSSAARLIQTATGLDLTKGTP
jgi:hypothetical protein